MFAVLKTGGKQYKVSEGDLVRVEKLAGDVGEEVSLTQVLMVGSEDDLKIGAPYVDGCSVTGVVTKQFRDKKVLIFKFKRRKKYRRKNGHRQSLTELKITSISQ
jgi:large subunit ribosomal protein L21